MCLLMVGFCFSGGVLGGGFCATKGRGAEVDSGGEVGKWGAAEGGSVTEGEFEAVGNEDEEGDMQWSRGVAM